MKNIFQKLISDLLKDEFTKINYKNKQINESVDILSCNLEEFKETTSDELDKYSEQINNVTLLLGECKNMIETHEKLITDMRENLDFYQQQLESYSENFKKYSENLRNNNIEMQKQRECFLDYSTNLKNNNEIMQSQKTAFESYSINLKNNNQLIDQLLEQISSNSKRMDTFERGLITLQKKIQSNFQDKISSTFIVPDNGLAASIETSNKYYAIDYLDFENHFRGSRSKIMENQRQYLSYFSGKNRVVDLGCGRGEFLELLTTEGIPATGVDFYEDFVLYCNAIGLHAIFDDALHYLKNLEYTDGIFVGQVVEHLNIDQILELCDLAYQKLVSDSFIIIETPNPSSLAIYANAFYIDPSHVKPIHPLTLEYCLRKSGFQDINFLYTSTSKLESIPALKCNNVENCNEFNEAMSRVSKILFGSQDYAIIARKE